jgi:hypothetical protein
MVQLLVDCVWDPNARDIAFESYAPRFFADSVPESNRLIINSYHASQHLRVISWIVLAKEATTPRLIHCPSDQVVTTSAARRRWGSNRIAHFCECHRAVHIGESSIGRTSYRSRESFIHSFSTDSVEKLAGGFVQGLTKV